jgi:hypothetical protein
MWIALYINCNLGHFKPVGPFESEMDAEQWILDNAGDPKLWSPFQVEDSIEASGL